MQQPINMTIPLNQLEDILCETCGQSSFVATMSVKRVSALYSPTGQPVIGQAHSGYACAYCGAMYDLNFNCINQMPEEE